MDVEDFKPLLVPGHEAGTALIRCNPRLMAALRETATRNMRSLNAELVVRLARSLTQEQEREIT